MRSRDAWAVGAAPHSVRAALRIGSATSPRSVSGGAGRFTLHVRSSEAKFRAVPDGARHPRGAAVGTAWAPCATHTAVHGVISARGHRGAGAARAHGLRLHPPRSGTWATAWCARSAAAAAGARLCIGSGLRRCSFRARGRRQLEYHLRLLANTERSSTSSRQASAVWGPGCTAWPARAACAPWSARRNAPPRQPG